MQNYFSGVFCFLALMAGSIIFPAISDAASCTPGTDCYCDRVKNVSNLIYDSNLLVCEDFEAPTLRLNQGVGSGPPFYGPPYDSTGYVGNRGHNGYWNRRYGNGGNNVLWANGQPSSPTYGSPCSFSRCTGLKIWSVGDLWNGNNVGGSQGPMAFLTDPQYTAEPNLVAPTSRSGGGSGSFDGAASLFFRVPAGQVAGITGTMRWSRSTTFGITEAVAYAPNVWTSNLARSMWKGNEMIHNDTQGIVDGIFLFGRPSNFNNGTFPFYQFMFSAGASQSTCNSRVSAATKRKGVFECDTSGNFLFSASPADYVQGIDWPLGSWGCVRAYYQNVGSSNTTIEMWFTGPSGVEKKVIDISGMNTTGHSPGQSPPGYIAMVWNNYANANQGTGETPTTQTSGRYEDNLHIRAGAPVSCNQIGYGSQGGGGGTTPPPAPTNLRVD